MNEKRENFLIGMVIVSSCLFFIAGYFFGKSSAIADYAFLIKESSFDEKIQGAFCTLPRSIGRLSKDKMSDSDNNEEREEKKEDLLEKDSKNNVLEEPAVKKGASTPSEKNSEISKKNNMHHEHRGYAQLVSFSSKQKATTYVEKLKKEGFSVHIVDHCRKTKKGKKIYWFQIVTEKMSMSLLKETVKKIAQKEKLQNYKIIELQK